MQFSFKTLLTTMTNRGFATLNVILDYNLSELNRIDKYNFLQHTHLLKIQRTKIIITLMAHAASENAVQRAPSSSTLQQTAHFTCLLFNTNKMCNLLNLLALRLLSQVPYLWCWVRDSFEYTQPQLEIHVSGEELSQHTTVLVAC